MSTTAVATRELSPDRLGDHLDRLYRAALALTRSPQDAEDLVQDTCVKVLKRPRHLREGSELGYLVKVLRNTFFSQCRRAGSRADAATPLGEAVEAMPDTLRPQPDTVVGAGEVFSAVAALPADYRDVIVRVDVLGYSYREAARELDVPQGTVMSRLYRARRGVAQALGEEATAA